MATGHNINQILSLSCKQQQRQGTKLSVHACTDHPCMQFNKNTYYLHKTDRNRATSLIITFF